MSKVNSWKMSEPKASKNVVVASKSAEYKWYVDRFPTIETRGVRTSYGDMKVVRKYGKK